MAVVGVVVVVVVLIVVVLPVPGAAGGISELLGSSPAPEPGFHLHLSLKLHHCLSSTCT